MDEDEKSAESFALIQLAVLVRCVLRSVLASVWPAQAFLRPHRDTTPPQNCAENLAMVVQRSGDTHLAFDH